MKLELEVHNEVTGCPTCGENECVPRAELEPLSGNCIIQKMECGWCGSKWIDAFNRVGYHCLQEASNKRV